MSKCIKSWLIRKSRAMSAKCVVSNIPSMVSNSHLGNGIWDFMIPLPLLVLRWLKRTVYLKQSKRSILILSLYVDDILLAGNDMDSIVTTKKWLSSTFEMMDIGEANFVLEVKITRDRSMKFLSLSQWTYIKKILECFHIHNSKPINTPMEKGYTLSLD